jgi:hypothetical protein
MIAKGNCSRFETFEDISHAKEELLNSSFSAVPFKVIVMARKGRSFYPCMPGFQRRCGLPAGSTAGDSKQRFLDMNIKPI